MGMLAGAPRDDAQSESNVDPMTVLRGWPITRYHSCLLEQLRATGRADYAGLGLHPDEV